MAPANGRIRVDFSRSRRGVRAARLRRFRPFAGTRSIGSSRPIADPPRHGKQLRLMPLKRLAGALGAGRVGWRPCEKAIAANHWAIYCRCARAAAWRRLQINYPQSNRIARFRRSNDFSHDLGGTRHPGAHGKSVLTRTHSDSSVLCACSIGAIADHEPQYCGRGIESMKLPRALRRSGRSSLPSRLSQQTLAAAV